MKMHGFGRSFLHDPAAALLVDGDIVAAAEEERFSAAQVASSLAKGPAQLEENG